MFKETSYSNRGERKTNCNIFDFYKSLKKQKLCIDSFDVDIFRVKVCDGVS